MMGIEILKPENGGNETLLNELLTYGNMEMEI
jgi:hypothetical protein